MDKIEESESRRSGRIRLPEGRVVWLYAAAFLLSALVLTPILHSGFMMDDAFNSSIWARSTIGIHGVGLFRAAIQEQLTWIVGQGRFFPVTAYIYPLFYFINGRVEIFKMFIFALVLLDLALLANLVRRISGSAALSVLTLVLAPLALQFRSTSFHDPTLGFAGMLPVLLAMVVGSLIFLAIYLERRERRFLVASLVLYGLSLITYEISIALFPLHFLIIWLYPKRGSIRASLRMALPYAGLAVGAVATAVSLRLYYGRALTRTAAEFAKGVAAGADMAAGAYAPNFAPIAVLTTFAKQVVAALPLSYQTIDITTRSWTSGFISDMTHSPKGGPLLVVAYAAIVLMVGHQVNRETASGLRPNWWAALSLGVGLVVLPQTLISLSPRYQVEVFWGVAYLPVYFGYFGMAALLAVVIYWLIGVAASRGRVILVIGTILVATGITYVGVVNFYNNQTVVELNNRSTLYPRTVVSQAIDRGLFEGLPPNSTLVVDGMRAWDRQAFYEGESGLVVENVIPLADLSKALPSGTTTVTAADGSTTYDLAPASTLYFISSQGYWPDNGYAVFARVRRVMVRPGKPLTIDLEPVFLYVADAPLPAGQTRVPAWPQEGLPGASLDAIGLSPKGLSTLSSGSDWSLFRTAPGQSITIQR